MADKELKNNDPKKKFWKFWSVMIFVNLGILAVVFKLFSVQIIQQDLYKEKARKQHQSRLMLSAERGKIYDRNGKVIASNFVGLSVAVDPSRLKNERKIALILQSKLGIPVNKTIEKIRNSKKSFVWLTRGNDPELIKELRNIDDKGLILIEEPRRIYHYGGTCSQVIGLTDIDNNGLSGIELQLDSLLKGQNGYMILNRDGMGNLRPAADLPIFPAVNGNSVKLTIDIELQRIVEYELKKGVEYAQAESGTVVAIEPTTGEILAIASYPNYNPYSNSKPKPGDMRVRAITDIYEPGSTFKTITAAAAIEENVVNENDKLNGYGGVFQGNGYTIRDVHGVGVVSFREAMEHSSNIILSTVANMMKDNVFYKYIRDFGFGIKTGIDFPGEVAGMVPKPHNFVHSTKRYLGHGYSLAVTPLQMTNSYAAIANKGVLMQPYLVQSIFNNTGEQILNVKPRSIRRVISEKTADRVKNLLLSVVRNGTGKAVKFNNILVGGKTGTSQQLDDGRYSKQHYTGSFAGFFPYDNPKVAMIVVIDRPKVSIYGGATAAPVFREIVLRWSGSDIGELEQVNLLDSTKQRKNDSMLVSVPNIIGLELDKAYKIIKEQGLKIQVNNGLSGIIYKQTPTFGTRLHRDSFIKVEIENPENTRSLETALQEIRGLPIRDAILALKSFKIKYKIKGKGFVKSTERVGYSDGIPIVAFICD
ncbi:MAG TPA: penicillin-binding transpeptidase domain-containing protein [Candidatus Kapabacteria bacterium]|nr:penicillin-binding transpeptidase domain-containing protein [Candidatus Kapabacteria bacterium]